MCLICVEVSNNRLSPLSAARNFVEIKETVSKEHETKVCELIADVMDKDDYELFLAEVAAITSLAHPKLATLANVLFFYEESYAQ